MGTLLPSHLLRPLSYYALVALFGFFVSDILNAQEQNKTPIPRQLPKLMPSVAGWIGFETGPLATRLTLFDFHFVEQVQSLWTGLDPIEYADHFVPSHRDSLGLILARADGVPTLYECSLLNRLNLEPRWGSEAGFQPTGLISLPGRGALLASDRKLLLIDSGWTETISRDFDIIHPPILVGADTIFLLYSDFAGVHAAWLSAENLTILHELRETATGELPEARIVRSGVDIHLLLYFRKDGRASFINLRTGVRRSATAPKSQSPLPLLFKENGKLRSGFLSNAYPAPSLLPGSSDDDLLELEYPLAGPPLNLIERDSIILMMSHDSVVVYRDDLAPLDVFAYSAGSDPVLYSTGLASHPYLLSSSTGSILIEQPESSGREVLEYLPQTVYGLIGLTLLSLIVLAAVRYRRMRAIYRSLVYGDGSAGVLIFSRRSRLLRINAPARALLNLPDSTPRARHASTYFLADGLDEVRQLIAIHLTSGTPVDQLVAIARGSNGMTVRLNVRRMIGRYGSNRGFIVVLEDQSDSVERDRLLNWASVAHHIAHEMKTPLGTIRMSSDRLRSTLLTDGADDSTLGTLGRIIRESARLRAIVEDLLTVARTDELVLNQIDLVLMIRSLADDMREYLPETSTISVDTELSSFVMEADADQLAVAIRNLFDNARQAVGTRINGDIRCIVELAEASPFVRITISDNGIGMSEETQRRLFQPFYTEKAGGSGIGTTIIKRVVEGHGGSISVESQLGEGTTFVLQLPINREASGKS